MTAINRAAVILGFAIASGFAIPAATAAPAPVDRSPTTVSDAVQIQPAAVAEDEDPAICSRSRKRLWVEGEGWIVRRVTICR